MKTAMVVCSIAGCVGPARKRFRLGNVAYCREHWKSEIKAGQRKRRTHGLSPHPCTEATVRCRSAQMLTVDTAECCKGHIRKITREISEIFAREGIRWWLDYGQLLGAIYNPLIGKPPGILPWDKDGDIGCFAEDQAKVLALRLEFEKMGRKFTLLPLHDRQSFRSGDRVKIRLSERNTTNVDVFFWHLSDGSAKSMDASNRPITVPKGYYYRKNYCSVDRFKGREFPAEKLLPLKLIEWEGASYFAPCSVLEPGTRTSSAFLEHRYTRRWPEPFHRNNRGTRIPSGWHG